MRYSQHDHTFAVCAYMESPFLEECIESLEKQSVPGNIIVCTATPNAHISDIANRHSLPVVVNYGPHGIAEDWNFAYASADTPLVTLAHQDDVYEPDYLKSMLDRLNGAEKPLIGFTNYYELRDGKKSFAPNNRNLKIKEFALKPMKIRSFQQSVFVRRRILSLCCAICCPSVTFVRENLPPVVFGTHFKCDLDWEAWENISRIKGSFCYVPEPLMGHRIHRQSTTTEIIGDSNGRSDEDLEMYLKFWPEPIAKVLNRFYSGAQRQNKV